MSAHTAPTTMGHVEDLIHERGRALSRHPFIQRLDGEASYVEFVSILPRLGFFVLAFQDMLRLSRAGCSDPKLFVHVEGLERGDRGHDQWYLEDIGTLGLDLDARNLFSAEYQVTRETTYELMSMVLHAPDDYCRLTLLLSLEETAHEFFERVSKYAKRAGVTTTLRFFGGEHLIAEESHEVFEEDAQKLLKEMVIPVAAREAVKGTVEHTFHAMTRLADDLVSAMMTVASRPASGVS
jgi:hypothetical protein